MISPLNGISLLFAAVLTVASTHGAAAACGVFPPLARNLADVRDRLILRSNQTTYVINDSCFDLPRNEFSGILRFNVLNRFPSGIGVRSASLLIKSYRVFSNEQSVKVKVSRGDGWFDERSSPLARLDDRPYRRSVAAWNAAHSGTKQPQEVNTAIEIPWHAYALADRSLSSVDDTAFWGIGAMFDGTYGSMTNILVRFDVNTETSESLVPFTIFVQPQVQTVELTISSNIESLSGTYKFTLR